MPHPAPRYTPEEDTILRTYWPTHSCTEIAHMIADRLGIKRSRCSIISRVHRKLMLEPGSPHRNKGDRPGKKPGPKPADRMVIAKAAVEAVISLPWVPGAQDGAGRRYVKVAT